MSEETNESAEAASATESYNLVFFPQIAADQDFEKVKSSLSETLKVDMSRVESWYLAEAPTVLLKGVAQDVAERYMEAILQCGASCNIQKSSEAGGLTLVPKSRNIDFFVCPSCEYEEEIPQGTKIEQCPKCGLVIAKWEEKMREEREKEAIRRRLLRDARHQEDRETALKRKRDELERLRQLEREIMKELGLKPPGRAWLFFEKHPISVSSAFAILIIAASGLVLHQVDQLIKAEEVAAQALLPPSEEIQQIAPSMAAAVQLQQNGNQAMIAEMADVTTVMRGQAAAPAQQKIVAAAQQMMKGVDPGAFVAAAANMTLPGQTTLPGDDGTKPVAVNTDTLGGVAGIPGTDRFEPEILQRMAPPVLEHGPEGVLQVLEEKRLVPDAANPGTNVVVDEIEKMDGSMIIDLMESLAVDQEWDQYLVSNVESFLLLGKVDEATELVNRISNPVVKVRALGSIMEQMWLDEPGTSLRLPLSRVKVEIDRIREPTARATAMLSLGTRLSLLGYSAEPDDAIAFVREMIADSVDPYEKSLLLSHLAVTYMTIGNKTAARDQFRSATDLAGQLRDPVERISAFTRIAQRYYDVRNLTLANEILSEAQVLAATQLPPADRSRIFAEIALAQAYLGDLPGAMISVRNASVGEGEQQLLATLAGSLINNDRLYDAQAVLDGVGDHTAYARLQLRLISRQLYTGGLDQARMGLSLLGRRIRQINDPAARGLIQSQYARLLLRAGQTDEANRQFAAALALSAELDGRKRSVNRALVALDQARGLLLESARITMEDVTDSIIRDPVDSEIASTGRVLRELMPEEVQAQIEPKRAY
ncbi:MAG: hypothetical protein ACFHX7_03355 [Pseudomonadota bacterium]